VFELTLDEENGLDDLDIGFIQNTHEKIDIKEMFVIVHSYGDL
jgi:hypothetical protein